MDVCHLTYNMIQGNQVIYERMKFPKIGKPLLIEKSKQIIEKYEGQGIDNYVFPVFTKSIPQRPKCVIESFKSLIESAKR